MYFQDISYLEIVHKKLETNVLKSIWHKQTLKCQCSVLHIKCDFLNCAIVKQQLWMLLTTWLIDTIAVWFEFVIFSVFFYFLTSFSMDTKSKSRIPLSSNLA